MSYLPKQCSPKWGLIGLLIGGTVACQQSADEPAVPLPSSAVPTWTWAKSYGGSSDDYARGVACGPDGQIAVTGNYSGSAFVGDQSVVSPRGPYGGYLLLLSPSGIVQRQTLFEGVGVDVDVDSQGQIVVAGTFSQAQMLGNGVAVVPTDGQRDVLIFAQQSNGTISWASTFGSEANDAGNEVVTGPASEVVATGIFTGSTLRFPTGPAVTKNGGDQDVWLAKWNPSGQFQWGLALPGGGHEEGRGVSVDGAGNVLLCGEFDGTLRLGADMISRGDADVYVARYSPAGQLQWARQFGGSGFDAARGIDPAPDGGVIVSGEFSGSVTFDQFTLQSQGGRDIFLMKLTAEGKVTWAVSMGSPSIVVNDAGCEIEVDIRGNIYVAGSAADGAQFPTGKTLSSAGKLDQFLAKFTPDGQLVWVIQGGGPEQDINFAIGLDAQGRSTLVGSFFQSARYGSLPMLTPYGQADIYIVHAE